MHIEDRVGRLERANRALAAMLAVAVGLPLAMGAWQVPKVAKEIRTRRVVVVDEKGAERITLENRDGRSELTMGAVDGQDAAFSVEVSRDGPSLGLMGPTQIVNLAARKGRGNLMILDHKGGDTTERFDLDVTDEKAGLRIRDRDGGVRFAVPGER